jgi:hypothetical protein
MWRVMSSATGQDLASTSFDLAFISALSDLPIRA